MCWELNNFVDSLYCVLTRRKRPFYLKKSLLRLLVLLIGADSRRGRCHIILLEEVWHELLLGISRLSVLLGSEHLLLPESSHLVREHHLGRHALHGWSMHLLKILLGSWSISRGGSVHVHLLHHLCHLLLLDEEGDLSIDILMQSGQGGRVAMVSQLLSVFLNWQIWLVFALLFFLNQHLKLNYDIQKIVWLFDRIRNLLKF